MTLATNLLSALSNLGFTTSPVAMAFLAAPTEEFEKLHQGPIGQ